VRRMDGFGFTADCAAQCENRLSIELSQHTERDLGAAGLRVVAPLEFDAGHETM
jgi:hypothetical protein